LKVGRGVDGIAVGIADVGFATFDKVASVVRIVAQVPTAVGEGESTGSFDLRCQQVVRALRWR
jgi:hypothetical protein